MRQIDIIDTQAISPRDRLEYWNSNAGNKVAPVAVHRLGDEDFNASLETRSLRNVSLLSLRATPCCINTRSDDHRTGMAHIAMSRNGTVLSDTAGMNVRLEAHDIALYDHSVAMDVVYPEGVDLLVLRMPIADLQLRLPMLPYLIGRKISGRYGGGALFAKFLTDLWYQLAAENEGDLDDEIEAVIWPMLQLAFAPESRSITQEKSILCDRRDELLGIVEARLCEADLRTETIARQLDVSPRTVQHTFARMGVTPANYIRNRRLDLAASRLAATNLRGRSVTDVCFDVGFNDLSSFCRNFRRRFGVSPSKFRKGERTLG